MLAAQLCALQRQAAQLQEGRQKLNAARRPQGKPCAQDGHITDYSCLVNNPFSEIKLPMRDSCRL